MSEQLEIKLECVQKIENRCIGRERGREIGRERIATELSLSHSLTHPLTFYCDDTMDRKRSRLCQDHRDTLRTREIH